LSLIILKFNAAKTAWAIGSVAATQRTAFPEGVAVAILVFDAHRIGAVPGAGLAVIAVLAGRTKTIGKVEAGSGLDAFRAAGTTVVETVGTTELAEPAIEFFGAAGARYAGALGADLGGGTMVVRQAAFNATPGLRVAVDAKARRTVGIARAAR
jgi:hypothetical protein